MRDGGVIRYQGRRGTIFRLRYRDADGRRVKETLGGERDGWTEQRAKDELRERLVAVKRDRLKKLDPVAFEPFAREWLATYPDAKDLKRSTRESYRTIVGDRGPDNPPGHLIAFFGSLSLNEIDVGHLERYLAEKRRQGLGPASLNRHLNVLHLIFAAAVRRQLVRFNPVSAVDRPREPRRRWTVLTPADVGRVERGFRELIGDAEGKERAWREQARVVFLTVVGAGLRRGEVLGLRWRDVELADPDGALLRVRETWVRSQADTPKSEAGERTIALDPVLAEELWQHRRRSSFQGEDERVFVSATGNAIDVQRYTETLRAALSKAEIDRPMRPFHDGRHTAITNDAAAGNAPLAIMRRAGHSDFKTTQRYIDLAGETFREEAERLGQRIFGQLGPKTGPK